MDLILLGPHLSDEPVSGHAMAALAAVSRHLLPSGRDERLKRRGRLCDAGVLGIRAGGPAASVSPSFACLDACSLQTWDELHFRRPPRGLRLFSGFFGRVGLGDFTAVFGPRCVLGAIGGLVRFVAGTGLRDVVGIQSGIYSGFIGAL